MAHKNLASVNIPATGNTYFVAPPIMESVTSTPLASFSDGAENCPVDDLTVEINPVQNLNGQSAPYPAGGGKNRCSVNEITHVGWATANTSLKDSLNALPNGTYELHMVAKITEVTKQSWWQFGIEGQNSAGNITLRKTVSGAPTVGQTETYNASFTITDANRGNFTAAYVYGCGNNSDGRCGYADLSEIQIESGSSFTSYAPYSNICPITGWTGMNVYQSIFCKRLIPTNYSAGDVIETKNGVTVKYLGDGKYHLFGTNTASSTTNFNPVAITSFTTQTEDDEHRIFAFNNNATGTANINFRSNGTWLSNATFNAVNRELTYGSALTGKEITDFFFSVSANATVDIICTPTFYDKNNTPLPISWSDEAGTVYGGTLDVTTGVLTVTHGTITLDGTETWTLYNGAVWTDTISDRAYGSGINGTAICDKLVSTTGNVTGGTSPVIKSSDWAFTMFSNSVRTYFYSSTLTTLEEWKTWFGANTPTICYLLATPQTYQLTPTEVKTLLGTNNLWADTGNVAVDYFADTKLYINKVLNA